jgi:hypothetical protein
VTGCRATLARHGIELDPSAVGQGPPWRGRLASDRHSIEVFDEVEQAYACNLLGTHAPTLQAFSGRAAVTPQGVEGIHSRLGAESLCFAPVEWASTAPDHLRRMQRFLKEADGVPRLERLEIFPAADEHTRTVNSALADGAMFVATTMSVAIVHQAMVMRARRLAREGADISLGWRALAERNRARVVTDGPRAVFEPNRVLARDRLLGLLTDLRLELQALNVTFDELAPLVLGPMLRRIGRGGLCTENDYTVQLATRCRAERLDFAGELRKAAFDVTPGSSLTRANRQAFPKESASIAEWWDEQLMPVATHDGRGVSVTARATPAPVSRQRPHAPSRPDPPGPGATASTAVAARLKALSNANPKQLGAELLQAVQGIDPQRFGILVAELPTEEKVVLRALLAPGSGRIPAVPAAVPVWAHASSARPQQIARSGGLAVVAIEESPDRAEDLRTRTAELFSTCPPELQLLSWKRFNTGTRLRQEFLLVRKVDDRE